MRAKTFLRAVAVVIAISLVAISAASCKTQQATASTNPGAKPGELILGEFLKLTANNESYTALVDNSGMSGIESSNHLCGMNASDMATFQLNENVVFSLEHAESLGQLYIWNYNADGQLNCGVKDITVQYSVDGANWSTLGTYTLNQSNAEENTAHGGCVAANYETPINFGGVSGKYISITATSNHGGATTGLSEIRLFRHKIRPGVGDMITGEAVGVPEGSTLPEAAVNNQGMSDLTTATATHNNVASDMWLTTAEANRAYIAVSLDGTYPIHSITLWNYNDPSNLDAGVQEFQIMYTTSSPCDTKQESVKSGDSSQTVASTFDFSKGTWKTLSIENEEGKKTNKFTLPKGTGDAALAGYTIELPEDIQAQHIKIVVKSNYGAATTGLSEIRFFAGNGYGVEPARLWNGLLSTSGSFAYSGAGTCSNGDANNPGYRNGGWLGADGMYSYHMSGDQSQGALTAESKTLITFEDSVIGTLNNYKGFNSQRGYSSASHSGWVNMTYLLLKGTDPDVRNAQYVLSGADSASNPYGNIFDEHYWLSDSMIVNGRMYVNAVNYMGWDTPEGPEGTDICEIFLGGDSFPDMNQEPKLLKEIIPGYADGLFFENTETAGAPDPDGYIYIYSRVNNDYYGVVRITPENYEAFVNQPDTGNQDTDHDNAAEKFEFWNGEAWIAGAPAALTARKANVTAYAPGGESNIAYMEQGPWAGKYVNVNTDASISGQLSIGVGNSLTGKIKNKGNIYWCTEKYSFVLDAGYDMADLWCYNSKSHPNLSKDGELLVSYHIGTQNAVANTTQLEYVHPMMVNLFLVGEMPADEDDEESLGFFGDIAAAYDKDGMSGVAKIAFGEDYLVISIAIIAGVVVVLAAVVVLIIILIKNSKKKKNVQAEANSEVKIEQASAEEVSEETSEKSEEMPSEENTDESAE